MLTANYYDPFIVDRCVTIASIKSTRFVLSKSSSQFILPQFKLFIVNFIYWTNLQQVDQIYKLKPITR